MRTLDLDQIFEDAYAATTESVAKACDFITKNLTENNAVSKDTLDDIILAADEATTNLVLHAYKMDKNKKFRIVVHIMDNKVQISLFDSGPIFSPENVPDPDLSTNIDERQIGGLGMFIMEKFLDKVQYISKSSNSDENETRLIKFIKTKNAIA